MLDQSERSISPLLYLEHWPSRFSPRPNKICRQNLVQGTHSSSQWSCYRTCAQADRQRSVNPQYSYSHDSADYCSDLREPHSFHPLKGKISIMPIPRLGHPKKSLRGPTCEPVAFPSLIHPDLLPLPHLFNPYICNFPIRHPTITAQTLS